jgi:hypothetical protein
MFHRSPSEQADYPGQSDLFVGSSMVPGLFDEMVSSEPFRSTDFSTCGEAFIYLKIDGINGLDGSIFSDKTEIEDALDEPLRTAKIGCVVGGGTGLRYSYIDFAVTDIESAVKVIRTTLQAGKIPNRCWLMYFDSDKADKWFGIWDNSPPPPM